MNKKIIWSVIRVISLIVLILVATIFGVELWFTKKQADVYSIGGGRSLDTSPVEVAIAGHEYLIPRNYISAYNKGGFGTGFSIDVLLPNLDPFSQKTETEFRKGGLPSTYIVPISAVPAEKAGQVMGASPEGSKKIARPTVASQDRFGLQVSSPINPTFRDQREKEFFVAKGSDSAITDKIECHLENAKSSDGGSFNPICDHMYFSNGLKYKALYRRAYLPDWKINKEKFLSLMKSFEKNKN